MKGAFSWILKQPELSESTLRSIWTRATLRPALKCTSSVKALQNWKWMLSSTLADGMYYELTYNGDKNEFYLDAYKKFENRVIPA